MWLRLGRDGYALIVFSQTLSMGFLIKYPNYVLSAFIILSVLHICCFFVATEVFAD